MREGTIANRYARALLSIAEEQGALEKIGADLQALAELHGRSPQLRHVLRSPAISAQERRAIVNAIATQGAFQPVTKVFLNLLTDKGRLDYLGDIAVAFRRLADERLGRVRAEVRSTAPLFPDELNQIRVTLAQRTGKDVVVEAKVDETLLGGVVARVGDTVYDSSLRSQLSRLRSDILASS